MRHIQFRVIITLFLLGIFFAIASVQGTPVFAAGDDTPGVQVDGLLDAEYSHLANVPASADNAPGDLYFYEGATLCYWAFITDRSYNDNVYSQSNAAYLLQDGWTGEHDFKKLDKSDHAVFNVAYGNSQSFSLYLDYVNQNSGGGNENYIDGTKSGQLSDGYSDGYAPQLAAVQTSIHWNILNSGWHSDDLDQLLTQSPPYNYNDSGDNYWEWQLIYEFSVAKSTMGGECGTVTEGGAHNSPAKLGASVAEVGDYVWLDANKNGIQDDGGANAGVENVTVYLRRASDNVILRTTQTSASGFYIFTNLVAGNYYVEFVKPAGYSYTTRDAGANDAIDSDANDSSNSKTATFSLAAGQKNLTLDAGLILLQPDIKLTKYTNGQDADTPTGPVVLVGSTVTWTYRITNTGSINLQNLTLFDDKVGGVTCPVTTLAVGASTLCTKTGIAQLGQYKNTAIVTGTTPTGSVTDTNPSHYLGVAPNISFSKRFINAVKQANGSWAVQYAIIVANTGSAPGTYTLTDKPAFDNDITINSASYTGPSSGPLAGSGPWTLASNVNLAAGQHHDYTLNVNVSMNLNGGGGDNHYVPCQPLPGGQPNQALFNRATLKRPGKPDTNADACGNLPAIELTKYTNGEDADTPTGPAVVVGSTVVWTYRITNTGGIRLQNLTLFDDKVGGITCPVTTLAVGASTLCTKTGIATLGQYANMAVVTGTTPTGVITPTVSVTDTNPSHYFGVVPNIIHSKQFVNAVKQSNGSWAVQYAIKVTNIGAGSGVYTLTDQPIFDNDITINNASFSSNVPSGNGLAGNGPWTLGTNVTLAAKASHLYTLNVNVSMNLNGGGGDNLYTACNPLPGGLPGQALFNKVTLAQPGFPNLDARACGDLPAIELTKYTNGQDADTPTGPVVAVGSTVTWTYRITNTGGITLTNLKLVDDKVGAILTCPVTSLPPAASTLCTKTGIAQLGQYKNTAIVTGTTPTGVITPTVSVTDTNPSHYFGVSGGLGDYVWYDKDSDGHQDANEAGTPNIPVKLLDSTCTTVMDQTTTDKDGFYHFTNLAPGSYCVQFDISSVASQYAFSPKDKGADDKDSDAASDGKTSPVTLAPGDNNLTLDAGLVEKSLAIEATALCIKDAPYLKYKVTPVNFTPGANPVTIRFLNASGGADDGKEEAKFTGQPLSNDALLWPGAAVNPTTKVGIQWPGWEFKNGVWLEIPTGLRPTVKVEFSVNPTNVTTVTYPPSNPTCSTDPRASLGDRVWIDGNQNGIQDASEAAANVAGVKVTLFNSSNQQVGQPTTTDANGNYLFTGLYPGVYSVVFDKNTLPPGYVLTTQKAGSDATKDSDADTNSGKSAPVTLGAGDIYLDLDAGIYKPSNPELAALGDTVWYDVNNNGLQDSGEIGVPNVLVSLFKSADNSFVSSQKTNAGGKYLFTDLPPGTYYVVFTNVNGYSYTHHDVDNPTKDAIDSDAHVPYIDLTIVKDSKDAELGEPYTFTIFYTNTENLDATGVVVTKTIPTGTFLKNGDDPDWDCNGTTPGSVCSLLIGNIAANAHGSKTFTINLSNVKEDLPDVIDFLVTLSNSMSGRSDDVTLDAGETDLTVDGGVVVLQALLSVETPTEPTNLPDGEQPDLDGTKLFLPTLQHEVEANASAVLPEPAAPNEPADGLDGNESGPPPRAIFLPAIQGR